MQKDVGLTWDRRKKYNTIILYYHTKENVDIVDLVYSKLPVHIKSKRWTINGLAFILDTLRANAKTILRESANSNFTTLKFTRELRKKLVTTNMERRCNNPVGIQTKIYIKMAEVLGKEVIARYEKPIVEVQRKRCGMRLEKIIAHKNCKTEKNKLNNKIKTIL